MNLLHLVFPLVLIFVVQSASSLSPVVSPNSPSTTLPRYRGIPPGLSKCPGQSLANFRKYMEEDDVTRLGLDGIRSFTKIFSYDPCQNDFLKKLFYMSGLSRKL